MKWSKNYNKCESCYTEEWIHKSRGYCSKCYPLILKKEKIQNWDKNNSKSLVLVSPVNQITMDYLIKSDELGDAKKTLISQTEMRLHLYFLYNTGGNGSAMLIEQLLERIAKLTNNVSNNKLFYGGCSDYQNFTNEHRKTIIKDLANILLSTRLILYPLNY